MRNFLPHYFEMRENNQAHLTTMPFHSNKLKVIIKHLRGKNICDAKANLMN